MTVAIKDPFRSCMSEIKGLEVNSSFRLRNPHNASPMQS